MKKIGFDNEKYLSEQKAAILKRVAQFNNKLYLEFGGKLLYDYHAARVLPGFDPNVKMRLLKDLSNNADIILCIYAGDIERKKVRVDFGITYDAETLIALRHVASATVARKRHIDFDCTHTDWDYGGGVAERIDAVADGIDNSCFFGDGIYIGICSSYLCMGEKRYRNE